MEAGGWRQRFARVAEQGVADALAELVGTRPDGHEARSRWCKAVEAVWRHTLRWGVDAPGPKGQVHDLEIARERQPRGVERALAEATRQHDLDRTVDRGIDPSL